jgi:hypothetical protein
VAPGSSARILNARDINAHIAMAVDSQLVEANYFRNFKLQSVLVGSHRVHPELCRIFPNPIMLAVLSTEYLALYYHEWLGETPLLLDDHSSVSSCAVDLLFLMGCNPIILVGQDLCYYDNKVYAGDSGKNPITGNYANMIEDVDIHGAKVLTYYGFKAVQNDMENIHIRYGHAVKIYNATEGGLNIHGMENVKFADMLQRYVEKSDRDVSKLIGKALAGGGADAGGSAGDIGNAGDGEGRAAGFFAHVMEGCEAVEKLLSEKAQRFLRFEKLKTRGVGKGRLTGEMAYISECNKALIKIPLYEKVIYRSIEQQLTYYRAGASHFADAGETYTGAELLERKLDEFTADFTGRLKTMITQEMTPRDPAQEPAAAP